MKYHKNNNEIIEEVIDYLVFRNKILKDQYIDCKKSSDSDDEEYVEYIVDEYKDVSEMIKELKYIGIISDLEKEIPIQIDLVDGVKMNNKYPDSFHIPTKKEKSNIKVGDVVKIIDERNSERFWVKVTEFITDELMVCSISNDLVGNQPYTLGDKIHVKKDNIINIQNIYDNDYPMLDKHGMYKIKPNNNNLINR
tara:strand:- start:44 stop:628 length:585 start_codon:yes stop_codon:yes gene_type:complete